ncbi:MAG: hypothetical protein IJ094_09900 [Bacilli bacterium]|nr:hypothetical protein [Bacilli bacterium]
MKKRLVIFMMALLMLFGGITTAKAEESNNTLNIIKGIIELYNSAQSSEDPMNEVKNALQNNITEYILNNPSVVENIVGDEYKYIYVGVTEEEYQEIMNNLGQVAVSSGLSEEGGSLDVNALMQAIYNSGMSLESLIEKMKNAELRDIVVDGNYNLPTENDGNAYHIILPVKINADNAATQDDIEVEVNDVIIEPIATNTSANTKNTNTNSSETKKATTTAASKKTVKNPKTGDVLFTILGTITLAGAGFVVTLKKAKQR